jgi:RNA polymerase sigma factor (sigma-70 family)
MDVHLRQTGAKRPKGRRGGPAVLRRVPGGGPGLAYEQVAQALGEWQAQELALAARFPECRGLSDEELEDLYQETTVALLGRRFHREEHLLNSLHDGIKKRALNLHRDERRREEIIEENSARLDIHAHANGEQEDPERVALIHQDRWIVSEFLAELTEEERRVFGLLAEGMKYRSIAAVLPMEVNQARNAARSCERKRAHFQLLYDTGRLCGFRSATIRALQSGESTSEELATRAFAHLEGCAHCRAEHKTNARRLRRSFQGQAAVLLPFPALVGHLGWFPRTALRAKMLQHRLLPDGMPFGAGGARERAAALLAGGAGAKAIAAGLATVAVIGGTIGATHVLEQPPAHHHHRARVSAASTSPPTTTVPSRTLASSLGPALTTRRQGTHRASKHRRSTPGHVVSGTHRAKARSSSVQREPGGFAYLGVPSGSSAPAASEPARTASHSSGGPFSP